MQCEIAKRNLLPQAVQHYLSTGTPFTFMSLYADEEPYPMNEVIQLQRERVAELVKQCKEWETNESLKTSLFIAEKQLKQLERRYHTQAKKTP